MNGLNPGDLRSVRKTLGKSQSELATLLGLSTRAVQSYEQGWRATPPYVQKLADLLLYLEWRKNNPKPAPCWTMRKCSRNKRSGCPAYQYKAGDLCWLITGDYCHGEKLDSWEEKLAECTSCPVMKRWLPA